MFDMMNRFVDDWSSDTSSRERKRLWLSPRNQVFGIKRMLSGRLLSKPIATVA
jgi:hypothetical protein